MQWKFLPHTSSRLYSNRNTFSLSLPNREQDRQEKNMLNLVCFLLTLFGILILILGLVQLNHNRKGMYTISKSGESLTNKLTLLILSPESNVPCFP